MNILGFAVIILVGAIVAFLANSRFLAVLVSIATVLFLLVACHVHL